MGYLYQWRCRGRGLDWIGEWSGERQGFCELIKLSTFPGRTSIFGVPALQDSSEETWYWLVSSPIIYELHEGRGRGPFTFELIALNTGPDPQALNEHLSTTLQVKNVSSNVELSGFASWICHLVCNYEWVSHLISLYHSFLIYKLGILMVPIMFGDIMW